MPGTPVEIMMAMVLVRGGVLVIAALGACMSIFLGWKLYRDGVISAVGGEAGAGKDWRFKLSAAGPGVFFAAFGMWLLVELVHERMDLGKIAIEPVEATAHGTSGLRAQAAGPMWQQIVNPPAPPRPIRVCYIYQAPSMGDGDPGGAELRADLNLAVDYLVAVDDSRFTALQSAQLNRAVATLSSLSQNLEAAP